MAHLKMLSFPTRDYVTRASDGTESQRWKQVTLKLCSGDEEIVVPMVQSTTGMDVKAMLADALGAESMNIELLQKHGCSTKKVRNSDEIPIMMWVKGISNFARCAQTYPHPIAIIGAGHMGLRQALSCERRGRPYELFERRARVGGTMWTSIANERSAQQVESPAAQLCWDARDRGALHTLTKHSCWPTRDEVLLHIHDVVSQYNVWPRLHLGCHVTEMSIETSPGRVQHEKRYQLKYQDVALKAAKEAAEPEGRMIEGDDDLEGADGEGEGEKDESFETFDCSCLCVFPGSLGAPRRATFPGEDEFGGSVEYGFGDECDYSKVANKGGMIVGMGRIAVESAQICVERKAQLIYVIAKRHNLLMPRMVSWFVNQSRMPPPSTCVLKAMEPMYMLYGKDPWSFPSVETTPERESATISQLESWAVTDFYFLSVYFGKVETIEGEVKRLKARSAVISSGRVISDVDYCIKVLGFDSDFGVDTLMKTTTNIGYWPAGDYRRWVCSQSTDVDGSRISGTGAAHFAAQATHWSLHFFDYPSDAKRLLQSNLFPENNARPDDGLAAYHYDPRTAATIILAYTTAVPALATWSSELNDPFRKESMWSIAPPEKFLDECKKDWARCASALKAAGSDVEPPPYPYSLEQVYDLLLKEQEDTYITSLVSTEQMNAAQLEEVMGQWKEWAKSCVAKGPEALKAFEARVGGEVAAPLFAADGRLVRGYAPQREPLATAEQLTLSDRLDEEYALKAKMKQSTALAAPTTHSTAAARHVFSQRAASPDARFAKKLQQEWLSEANAMKQSLQVAHAAAKAQAQPRKGLTR